jgi:hypothetical protein
MKMRRAVLLMILCLTIQTVQAGREKREERHFRRAEHAIRLVCYQNQEMFEIEVIIDGERVFTAHHISENLLSYSFSKIEGRLDAIIADYEDDFGFFGPMETEEKG